jgi:hypothetical protein
MKRAMAFGTRAKWWSVEDYSHSKGMIDIGGCRGIQAALGAMFVGGEVRGIQELGDFRKGHGFNVTLGRGKVQKAHPLG